MDAESIKALAVLYGAGVDDSRPANIHIDCPFGKFHSRGYDDRQGLSVKVAEGGKSVAYCHSCGASGSLTFVFQEAAKADTFYEQAYKFVLQNDGASLSAALGRMERTREAASNVNFEVPSADWSEYARRCRRLVPAYLVHRGVTQEDVQRWHLGYDEDLQRAIFPVWDHKGKVVGCLRRAIHPDQDPKYYDTPGADAWKKSVFYGEHRIDPTLRIAYLVEGGLDVIGPSRFLPNVLGLMGSSTGIEGPRLVKLKQWADVLVFLLDPDKGGRKAFHGFYNPKGKLIHGLKQKLRRDFIVKEGLLPEGFDPWELVRQNPTMLQEIVRRARYLAPDRPLTSESPSATVARPSVVDYLAQRRAMSNKPPMLRGVEEPRSGT